MEIFGFDLSTLEYWHWFIIAGVFFILELLSMTFVLLWFGVSAVFVGILMIIFPALEWTLQLLVWGGMAAADVIGWRFIMKGKKTKGENADDLMLNRRGDQYIGRTFTIEDPIVNGFGKIKVDDTHWTVECTEDLPAGTKIKVTAVRGTALVAEPY